MSKIKKLLMSDNVEDQRIGYLLLKKLKPWFSICYFLEWIISLPLNFYIFFWKVIHINHLNSNYFSLKCCFLEFMIFMNTRKWGTSDGNTIDYIVYDDEFEKRTTSLYSDCILRIERTELRLTPFGFLLASIKVKNLKKKMTRLEYGQAIKEYIYR